MSGLSRLAAAASQPDDVHRRDAWEQGGGGGTGLTPPSSPGRKNGGNNQYAQGTNNAPPPPTLYRREETEHDVSVNSRGYVGTTPSLPVDAHPSQQHANQFTDFNSMDKVVENNNKMEEEQNEDNAGWSDDEFVFDDSVGEEEKEVSKEANIESKMKDTGHSLPAKQDDSMFIPKELEVDGGTFPRGGNHQPQITLGPHMHPHPNNAQGGGGGTVPPPPPPPLPTSEKSSRRTFDEEFVMVLKDKIDAECKEMEETGRMKRWTPIRDDPILRKQLMEVMVAQIHS